AARKRNEPGAASSPSPARRAENHTRKTKRPAFECRPERRALYRVFNTHPGESQNSTVRFEPQNPSPIVARAPTTIEASQDAPCRPGGALIWNLHVSRSRGQC